ncbi:MAG: tetratricopeptide repeat protein [Myxococcales bacterium]|nr:tetratricopeptide repeat protein [Myxococcales bacterium]
MLNAPRLASTSDACPDEGTILEFIDGVLARDARAALERHVDVCPSCQSLMAALARELVDEEDSERAAFSGDESTFLPAPGSEPTLAASPGERALTDAVAYRESPTRLGRYLVIEPLGAGGMGVVYAAYDAELDRKLAIKLLRAGRDGDDERARLLREAQAMARLSHPNVVSVFDVGTLDDAVFVAMEHVDGATLRAWRTRRDRSWREIVDVYIQAGKGLVAAHDAGLIHRDFKPHNAMIDRAGVVKVLDFGLARLGASPASVELARTRELDAGTDAGRGTLTPLTRTGAIMGTPAYMPLEQHQGRQADARSDQFSFCVALYEALYGEHPFAFDSLLALVRALEDGRVRPAPVDAQVPAWLRAHLLRGLARDPDARHPSMRALLDALARDPAELRRKRRVLAAFGGAVAVVSASLAALYTGSIERCVDLDDELTSTWSAERAEALRAALVAAAPSRAEGIFGLVRARLDRYVDDWSTTRVAGCEGHRRGRLSDELYTLQTACLERRRASLEAFVDIVAEGGARPVMIDRVVAASAALPPIEPCGDAAYLSADVRPPESAATRLEVEAQRHTLDRAREHEQLGQYDEALALVDEVASRAAALDYGPLVAEAWFRRGSARVFALSGDPGATEEALTRAVTRAVASGHERLAAEAGIKRLYVRAAMLGEAARARDDVGLIEAWIEHVGGDTWLEGQLLHNVGIIHSVRGELDAARDAYTAALERKRRTLPRDDPELIYSMANLAYTLHQRREYEAAIELLSDALARGDEALGSRHPQIALVASMLASSLIATGQYGRARAAIERALEIHGDVDGAGPVIVPLLMQRGEVALRQRAYEDALTDYGRAYELAARSLGDAAPNTIYALLGYASALSGAGEHERAVAMLEHALALQEDDASRSAETHLLLGEALLAADDTSAARREFQLAAALAEPDGGLDSSARVQALEGLGRALHREGQLDAAARVLQDLLEVEAPTLPPTNPERINTRRALARVLVDLERRRDAVLALREAIAAYEAVPEPPEAELAITRFELAQALPPGRDAAEALELARAAQRELVDAGPGYALERATVDAWLAARR